MNTPLPRAVDATSGGAGRPGAGSAADAPDVPGREQALRRRLGEVLAARGLVTAADVELLLAEQARRRAESGGPPSRLGRLVVDAGLATEQQVATALAEALRLPVVDLATTPVDPEVARLVPRPLAERHGLLALRRDRDRLLLAAADPTDVLALDDVRLVTGVADLDVVVATAGQVRSQLARVWSLRADADDVATLIESIDSEVDEPPLDDVDDTPTVRIVDAILGDAVRIGASDVHVEQQREGVRIRYRVDGVLRDVMTVPRAAGPSMVSRLKILGAMDIAERRVPQDGRARITADGHSVDARLSTLPAVHGEKVVVRLLPGADDVPTLEGLGLDSDQEVALRRALAAPQGLVLITGPTGSGKTGSLYAAIQAVMTPERNVVTLEDPVEIQLPGITQVSVNERAGMTFARGLRAVLRQDPDVVLVGEVRDLETAELALRSSLTGHLVLSTLHTNDSVSAVTRLVDMGIPAYLVASSLSLVVAQRLVRRPCASCAQPYRPDPELLAALGASGDAPDGRRGTGCRECSGTGYRGRRGVFELLRVSPALRRALLGSAGEAELARIARTEGFRSLREAALALAERGETTYEEALRATLADQYADRPAG